ncbi:MAG TPA: squalene/phytoene synthase family protein, partial [Gammaproteobacteria bacterium]|nr:squalene/phytoene synthase family protein [Gammaproteobacteria bacterium]
MNPGAPAAYRACRRLARDHYENFPVASLLLPRRLRDPVAAIYAFA